MTMPKVILSADERYPDYSVRTGSPLMSDYEVDATEEQLHRWQAAAEAYEAAQREMGELYDSAADAHRERVAQQKAEREASEKAERDRKRREAQAAAEAKARAQGAVWAALKESGGIAYDANGNPIGKIEPAGSHGQARVIPLGDL